MRGPDAERSQLDFERWRTGDPRRRAAYASLERDWELAAGLADTPMGRAPIFVRRPSIFAMPGPRIAFANLALIVAIVSGAFLLWPRGGTEPVVAQAQAPLATGIGEIRTIRLADGSTVTLDTDSAIEVVLSNSARVVRLTRGRARFDVAHDAARPFMVEADGRTVIARGTLFDVVLGREGVRVTLLRGSVDVRGAPPAAGRPAPVARLVPGQTFSAAPKGEPRVMTAPKGSEQWVSGMLSFDGAPLAIVIDEANRYSPHKLRLATPELASLRVTGVFNALPTDALAAALAAAFNLRVERAANGDFVLHAR
jgi:transmembrane sensor